MRTGRATSDVDSLIDVRALTGATKEVARRLRSAGGEFEPGGFRRSGKIVAAYARRRATPRPGGAASAAAVIAGPGPSILFMRRGRPILDWGLRWNGT